MNANNNKKHINRVKKSKEVIKDPKQSLRRSLLAKKLLIKGENLKQFEELRAKILQEIPIHTEIENILCEKFISAVWKLQRAMEIEKNLLNEQNIINEFEESDSWSSGRKRIRNIKKIRLNNEGVQQIIQYQIELEKAMQKSLERLREEQTRRLKS